MTIAKRDFGDIPKSSPILASLPLLRLRGNAGKFRKESYKVQSRHSEPVPYYELVSIETGYRSFCVAKEVDQILKPYFENPLRERE